MSRALPVLLLWAASCLAVAAITPVPAAATSAASAGTAQATAASPAACDGVTIGTTVNLSAFPDLHADETNAGGNEWVLQCIFNNVPSGATIVVPAGAKYAHSADLVLNVPNVSIQGPSGTTNLPWFESTNVVPANGENCLLDQYGGPCLSLALEGSGDSISNVALVNTAPHSTSTLPPQCGLVLKGDSQTANNVLAYNSDRNGILLLGATNATVDTPSVVLSRDAGIYITSLAAPAKTAGGIFVQNPTVTSPGDDGVAVEWGVDQPTSMIPHNIWVNGLKYTNTPDHRGHGIAVVGGSTVTLTNFNIDGGPAGGIYVADGQPAFHDAGSKQVVFNTGIINHSGPTNGAALVWSDTNQQTIDHIDVENVWIANTSTAAGYQVGDFPCTPQTEPAACAVADPPATNVEFKNLTFTGNTSHLLDTHSTPPGDYWTLNWQVQNPDGTFTTLPDHSPGTPPFPN